MTWHRATVLAAVWLTACSTAGTDPSGLDGSEDGSSAGQSGADGSDGAHDSTGDATEGPPTTNHHPPGYEAPEVHGLALKMHEEDCRQCHGMDLSGGPIEPSCDACHQEGWRTDCVYCHGGTIDGTGAPPRDLDGTTDTSLLSFIAHSRHVSIYQHDAYGCEQCHRKPVDVLSEGHVFDDTDAHAEIDFSAGLSPNALWDGAGTCASLYCHGNGRTADGLYTHDAPEPTCGGCHPFPATENTAFATMSGEHARHANAGLQCAECHDPLAMLLHVDGKPDVSISQSGFQWDPGTKTCTGLCHLRAHASEGW